MNAVLHGPLRRDRHSCLDALNGTDAHPVLPGKFLDADAVSFQIGADMRSCRRSFMVMMMRYAILLGLSRAWNGIAVAALVAIWVLTPVLPLLSGVLGIAPIWPLYGWLEILSGSRSIWIVLLASVLLSLAVLSIWAPAAWLFRRSLRALAVRP